MREGDVSERYGKKKGKSVAYAIATQQAHALKKSPKGFRTPEGVRTAKKKYDEPGEMKKTAKAAPKVNEGEAKKLLGKRMQAHGEAMQAKGRRMRNIGYLGGAAALGASFIPGIRGRTWIRRGLRAGAALGGLYGYAGEAGPHFQGRAYQMYGQQLRGKKVPRSHYEMSSPSVRAMLEHHYGPPQLAGGSRMFKPESSKKAPAKPRAMKKESSAPRALVLIARRNDVLNKIAAVQVSVPPPVPTVPTSLTPQPVTNEGGAIKEIKGRSLKSTAAPSYSKSHSVAAAPTRGMGLAAKNVPPPVVRT